MTHLEFLSGQGLLWIDPNLVRWYYDFSHLAPIRERWGARWEAPGCCGWVAAGCSVDYPEGRPLAGYLRDWFSRGFDGQAAPEGLSYADTYDQELALLAHANGRACWERVQDLAPRGKP